MNKSNAGVYGNETEAVRYRTILIKLTARNRDIGYLYATFKQYSKALH